METTTKSRYLQKSPNLKEKNAPKFSPPAKKDF
jgi:hypothetical protein